MFRKNKPTPKELNTETNRPLENKEQENDHPELMRFERDERREWVRRIENFEVIDGDHGVLSLKNGERIECEKNRIDVDALARHLSYQANYMADFDDRYTGLEEGRSRYTSNLTAQLELVGGQLNKPPLLWFPPHENEHTNGAMYSCVFDRVTIGARSPQHNTNENPKPSIETFASYEAFDQKENALFQRYSEAQGKGEKFDELFSWVKLNTKAPWGRSEKEKRSFIMLPHPVFKDLKSDIFSIGDRVKVVFRLCIETYVANCQTNYGWPEFDDQRMTYDWAIIPFGCVLTAELQDLELRWREPMDTFDRTTDERVFEPGANFLDGIPADNEE